MSALCQKLGSTEKVILAVLAYICLLLFLPDKIIDFTPHIIPGVKELVIGVMVILHIGKLKRR